MTTTLGAIIGRVQIRTGDTAGTIWSAEEIADHIRDGYRIVTTLIKVLWDQVYLENLPPGFSYSQPWELALLRVSLPNAFDYGCANFSYEDERVMLDDGDDTRIGPANHTSPFEATDGILARALGEPTIPATAELPASLTAIDRATWNQQYIEAMSPRHLRDGDTRYQITTGEVYGYTWREDGVRTFRKIRVPAAQAETVTVNGSWGLLRDPTDLSGSTVSGTWGICRRIPNQHPIGSCLWGTPRRPYLDGMNVRVEHFRHGRPLIALSDVCELPDRYAAYLDLYALARVLERPSPGADLKLAGHYDQRWARGLARIQRRVQQVETERVSVMGGGAQSPSSPPRPVWPWQYGSRVR